ncbi:Major facilitator superfamily domain, general substrate transporter [Pseudocohnilembus persalinus]|uniref:Major facilitator superfamily domain, general substrate transporter n=1 Tax=Pseudocohnilembus persalinus TaxID=266149 RepID=A0A0V0Q7M8_PSEPJ|nr:Major facilitator superfamily domain, general substrate transporter [Pseudocohnilembus persalinus]|eukprot:KRW98237.1 Major facilitator superfamily domain, general substrate transporter [Pseudocohnilembus persalinus]
MTPFGLLSLPIFNCLISYFPRNIGKVTGLLLFVFGISQFIFQLAAFYMINPKNKKATIQYYYHDNQDEAEQEGHKSILLFDEEIANNIMPSLVSLGLVCGILTIYGGFKVKNKYEEDNQIQIENQRQNQNRISIELQNMEVSTIQLQDVQEKKSLTQDLLNYEPNLTILQAIFKEPFLIIRSFCNLIGSFSNILWGAAVDKYPLKYIYLSMTTVFCIIAILFPILAYNRFALTFIYFGLHVIQQGALAMTLPAIIYCLILPLLSYYSVKTGNFDMVFFILGILEISSILVVLKMKARYRYD